LARFRRQFTAWDSVEVQTVLGADRPASAREPRVAVGRGRFSWFRVSASGSELEEV
jgi:hypothetical protein